MMIANKTSAIIGDIKTIISFINVNAITERTRILIQTPIIAIAIIRVLLLRLLKYNEWSCGTLLGLRTISNQRILMLHLYYSKKIKGKKADPEGPAMS